MFQSAPAGEGGRCRLARAMATALAGFNPRPPVKAGGAEGWPSQVSFYKVSIRARR